MNLETTQVERMYGVMHGGQIDFLFAYSQKLKITPSVDLLSDLETLPSGSVVGIETFDPKQVRKLTKKIDSKKFILAKEDDYYWDQVIGTCQTNGLKVVYLDDFVTYRQYVAKLFGQQKHEQEVSRLYQRKEKDPIKEYEEAREAVFKAEVESQYIHEIKREEKILENIVKFKPRRVIIGLAHADYLISNPQIFSDYGISIGSYMREGFDKRSFSEYDLMSDWMFEGSYAGNRERQAKIIESEIDKRILLERALLERKYRLITGGKLIPDKTPDYVGSWDRHCPLRGYFEVYVNGQAEGEPFSGIIEDTLGTADFEGEINDTYVQFLKTYIDEKSSIEACSGDTPIFYEGFGNNGRYIGKFSVRDENGRLFFLNKGSKLLSLE